MSEVGKKVLKRKCCYCGCYNDSTTLAVVTQARHEFLRYYIKVLHIGDVICKSHFDASYFTPKGQLKTRAIPNQLSPNDEETYAAQLLDFTSSSHLLQPAQTLQGAVDADGNGSVTCILQTPIQGCVKHDHLSQQPASTPLRSDYSSFLEDLPLGLTFDNEDTSINDDNFSAPSKRVLVKRIYQLTSLLIALRSQIQHTPISTNSSSIPEPTVQMPMEPTDVGTETMKQLRSKLEKTESLMVRWRARCQVLQAQVATVNRFKKAMGDQYLHAEALQDFVSEAFFDKPIKAAIITRLLNESANFDPCLKTWAVQLHQISKEAYDHVSTAMSLPCYGSLVRTLRDTDTEEKLARLAKLLATMSPAGHDVDEFEETLSPVDEGEDEVDADVKTGLLHDVSASPEFNLLHETREVPAVQLLLAENAANPRVRACVQSMWKTLSKRRRLMDRKGNWEVFKSDYSALYREKRKRVQVFWKGNLTRLKKTDLLKMSPRMKKYWGRRFATEAEFRDDVIRQEPDLENDIWALIKLYEDQRKARQRMLDNVPLKTILVESERLRDTKRRETVVDFSSDSDDLGEDQIKPERDVVSKESWRAKRTSLLDDDLTTVPDDSHHVNSASDSDDFYETIHPQGRTANV